MRTYYDITLDLYKILNRETLTNNISGKVYKDNKPMDSELEDIVINVLDLKTSSELQSLESYSISENELQVGIMNVNIYCKNISGVPNQKRLNEILQLVLTLLDDNIRQTSFTYRIEDTLKIISEMQQNPMSYLNIKLKTFKH